MIPLYLNISLCDWKCKNWNSVLASSNWVLEHSQDPLQVLLFLSLLFILELSKAHYRIGEALREGRCAKAALWHYEKSYTYNKTKDAESRITFIRNWLNQKEEQNKGKFKAGFFTSPPSLSM
jgi:hypothetical protein